MVSNFATNLFAFILVLGFLIFAHEAGHFFFAKLFRVRVLVFSFGFGKRLFGFRRGDTDYRVSLIPLGGYVKMAGDNPEEKSGSDPDEFLSRPKWQRFLILVAGPGMNLLIALLFLAALFMAGTETLRDSRPVSGSVLPGKPAAAAGIRAGDLVVEANGDPVKTWEDFKLAISMNANSPVHLKVVRDGRPVDLTVVPERQAGEYGSTGMAGVTPYLDTELGKIVPGSAAARAGLRPGDRIVEVAGRPTPQLIDLETALAAGKVAALPIVAQRGTARMAMTLPMVSNDADTYPGFYPPTEVKKYGPVGALRQSFIENVKMLKYTFATIGRLFRSEGSVKELSGPISIARISGEMLRTGWRAVIFLMANISLQLGIMNLLPIPILDGGHIMILLVEGAARRDLSLRLKERIQQLGFAVLAALMLVVLYNDVLQNVMRLRKG